jgi:hypothetical protein
LPLRSDIKQFVIDCLYTLREVIFLLCNDAKLCDQSWREIHVDHRI